MEEARMFEIWKGEALAEGVVGDGQCVSLVVNNVNSWTAKLFPGITWTDYISSVKTANQLMQAGNSKYFLTIVNDHADVNQLPLQGDIMVFDSTPSKGYSDTVQNSAGHCGVCDSASASGYTLMQQNAPAIGQHVNDSSYAWNYRPCLGWLRPINQLAVTSAPVASANVGKTLTLPKLNANQTPDTVWHVYNVAGPYDLAHATHVLDPALYGGLKYVIQADMGNGIYVIDTQDYGQVAIWTEATNAVIS
jgi:hypothetical protein